MKVLDRFFNLTLIVFTFSDLCCVVTVLNRVIKYSFKLFFHVMLKKKRKSAIKKKPLTSLFYQTTISKIVKTCAFKILC